MGRRKGLASSLVAAWGHIRRGDLRSFGEDLRRRLGFRPRGVRTTSDDGVLARVKATASPVTLLLDHDLGGGAALYARRIVEREISEGRVAIRLFYSLQARRYGWEISAPGHQERLYTTGPDPLGDILEHRLISRLVVNGLVSTPDPLGLLALATWAAREWGLPVRLPLHDYYPLCPSYPLLNQYGVYCGVPPLETCAPCLAANPASYFHVVPKVPVGPWRAAWGALLDAAEEVTVFSRASRGILRRAYPDLPEEKIALVPHDLGHLPARPIRTDPGGGLHIGVLGHITHMKGAAIVRAMAEHIERHGIPARITVFGTLEADPTLRCLDVTGPYALEQLPGLIEASGANLFFLPSIWPETFSFVTHELMAMGLPVAAFELGAPAESLGGYPLGRLIGRVDPLIALEELLRFHQDLKGRYPAPERQHRT